MAHNDDRTTFTLDDAFPPSTNEQLLDSIEVSNSQIVKLLLKQCGLLADILEQQRVTNAILERMEIVDDH